MISIQNITEGMGPDEIRRDLWPDPKGTWSLRGQGNEEEPAKRLRRGSLSSRQELRVVSPRQSEDNV